MGKAKKATSTETLDQPIDNTPLPGETKPQYTPEEIEQFKKNGGSDEFSDELDTIVSAAEYWPFNDKKGDPIDPVFIGFYTGVPFLRKTDDAYDTTKKAGDCIGYLYSDIDGEEHIIGNSYTIEEAHKTETPDHVVKGDKVRIEYLGRTTKSDGQSVNKFKVQKYQRKQTV